MNDLKATEEDMIRRKRKEAFEREARAKLPQKNWRSGIDFLMRVGVATADDWGVVAEHHGRSVAMRTATALGFPLDEPETSHSSDYRN